MKVLSFLILILTLLGCSSKRTQYHAYNKKEGGFTDGVLEDQLRVTKFEANSLTKKSYAEMFARYRSLEECRQEENKYAHVIGVIDKSDVKKVTRTNGDAWGPSYYYGMGMSPFYSRYSGFGFSTGINTVNSRSWEETLVYPDIEVIYHCAKKVYEPAIAMRDVPPEEMAHLVKDLKGGIQVEKILPDSPNKNLQEEDIIIRAAGRRIMKGHQLLALFKDAPDKVPVTVLREGEKKQLILVGKDITPDVEKNLTDLKHRACEFKDVMKKSSTCKENW